MFVMLRHEASLHKHQKDEELKILQQCLSYRGTKHLFANIKRTKNLKYYRDVCHAEERSISVMILLAKQLLMK